MRLIILGAGGYGRTISDLAEQSKQYSEILFLDDKAQASDVIGSISEYRDYINSDTLFFPAIGDNELRASLLHDIKSAGGEIASVVHSSAYISPKAIIGIGVAILPHTSIGTGVRIGDGSIINMNAVVDHDCVIEECVHIAPGAIVKGENRISRFAKVDSGTVIERGSYR